MIYFPEYKNLTSRLNEKYKYKMLKLLNLKIYMTK